MNAMMLPNWKTMPIERLSDGVERQMIWGDRLMVCRLRLAPRTVTPVHSHEHEQITIVERGRASFTISGVQRITSPGDVLHFPSWCEHGAAALDDEVVLIDIFSPVRKEFLPGAKHDTADYRPRQTVGPPVTSGERQGSTQ
jgi:quercetin dioxygenase-like cupin family protein